MASLVFKGILLERYRFIFMARQRRISVVLNDETFEVLEELCDLQDTKLSTIIRSFMEESLPELKSAIHIIRLAKEAESTGSKLAIEALKQSVGHRLVELGGAVSDLERMVDGSEKDSKA